MKTREKITRFFQGNSGRWVLTGIFVLMLISITAYTEFFRPEQPTGLISADAEGDNPDAVIIEPGIDAGLADNASTDDGQALRPDPDTTVEDPPAVEAQADPSEWLIPLSGDIGRKHGFSHDPTYNDYRFHHGIDIMAEPGTPVYAAAAGKVKAAREDSYWGGVVIMEHGESWQSFYRCLEPVVSAGDKLDAGGLLGYILESSPNEAAQEAHLHYEMYLNGDEVNPADWL
jgi:murein DD-endopeptidase MepM/ murein hydrolase activator NlpD